MNYNIEFLEAALVGIERLKKAGDKQALKKLRLLIKELEEHPETGTGKPEQLRGNFAGKWSRRITDKHRLVYEIINETVCVCISSTFGHYGDK